MQNFSDAALPQALLQSLARMNFTTPTPIQCEAIPLALEGKDILGSAQTGTGKTGAFGIPLVARLLSQPTGTALVLTPTRELAVQVLDALRQMLGARSPIHTALLIGGEPMPKQFQQLRMKPRLVVGTPDQRSPRARQPVAGRHPLPGAGRDRPDAGHGFWHSA